MTEEKQGDYIKVIMSLNHEIDDSQVKFLSTKGLSGNVLHQFSQVISREMISKDKLIKFIEARQMILGIAIANFEDSIEIAEEGEVEDLKQKAEIGRQRINELDMLIRDLGIRISDKERMQ